MNTDRAEGGRSPGERRKPGGAPGGKPGGAPRGKPGGSPRGEEAKAAATAAADFVEGAVPVGEGREAGSGSGRGRQRAPRRCKP
eukprot:1189600-Prorocentrum_minimum.AAC.1